MSGDEHVEGPAADASVRPRRPIHNLLEVGEWIVSIVALALILRFYVGESFVIPTGSMAPTLLGRHHTLQSPSTGRAFAVDHVRGGGFSAIDTRTGERIAAASNGLPLPVDGGDHIAVDKLAYRLGEPERWDVVVFKFPLDPTRNFVKRLVGLPGERLAIEHGDILINGRRVAKPRPVQDALWFCVYDQAGPGAADAPSPWIPQSRARWTGGDGARLSAASRAFVAGAGERPTRLRYSRRIEDYYDYNPLSRVDKMAGPSGERLVADLCLETTVIANSGVGVVRLGLVENSQTLALSLPVKSDPTAAEARVERLGDGPLGALSKTVPGLALEPGVPTRVRFSWHDRRLIVAVDGVELLRFDDASAKAAILNSGAWLEAPKQGARFEQVRLSRDMVYFGSDFRGAGIALVDGAVQLPEDGYFMLGDNAPNSADSRVWGLVRRGHLVGRAALVFFPPERLRFIR